MQRQWNYFVILATEFENYVHQILHFLWMMFTLKVKGFG